MPSFEEVCQKIFSGPHWLSRFLIGGLIMFVPVLNIFALGYLYRYALQVRREGNFTLPEWSNAGRLFMDGIRFLAILLVFLVLPGALGWGLAILLRLGLSVTGLAILSYIPFALAWVIGLPLSLAGLYLYQSEESFEALLRFEEIFFMTTQEWRHLVIPGLAFTGLVITGLPVYGLAIFLGFTAIIAYYHLVFRFLEERMRMGEK